MRSWTTLLAQSLQPIDKVPKRFKTVKQLAAEHGVSGSKMWKAIEANRKDIEVQNYRIKVGSTVRLTPHYALKA
jgi:hypothetical protein